MTNYQVAESDGTTVVKGGISTDRATAEAWAEYNNNNQPDSVRNGGYIVYFVTEADSDCIDWCQYRCESCAYLVEGDHGEWICDDCGKEIHAIPDDECSANMEW